MARLLSYGRKVWVAGHQGLVGSALTRTLKQLDVTLLQAARDELDLRRQQAVEDWMERHRPEVIIIAAARVGGIGANSRYPADFLSDNLAIAQNIIPCAAKLGTEKLVFLGSSCIYPKFAPQPIQEESLLTDVLEPTNEAYAIAKIAGLKLCQYYRQQYGHDFISVMPCNLYGPGDRWQDAQGHVIPMLIKKFHHAKINQENEVSVWGSGTPLREFLYVDDLAEAILVTTEQYSDAAPMNIGSGEETSIAELARSIAAVVGFSGSIILDPSKPDGTPRKVLDSRKIKALGWAPLTNLDGGLRSAYADYLSWAAKSPDRISTSN